MVVAGLLAARPLHPVRVALGDDSGSSPAWRSTSSSANCRTCSASPAQGTSPSRRRSTSLPHPSRDRRRQPLTGVGALADARRPGPHPARRGRRLVALAVPTVAGRPGGGDSVARVATSGRSPPGLPLPGLPELAAFSSDLSSGALAVAAIVLVQGAGVAESAPKRRRRALRASTGTSSPRASATSPRSLQGAAGRRLGRADRPERRSGRAQPLGVDLLGDLDAADPAWRSPASSGRWRCRHSPPS